MVSFDEAIPVVLEAFRDRFNEDSGIPERMHVVRDLAGQLIVVLPDESLKEQEWDEFARHLDSELAAYSPGQARVLLRESDLIDARDVLDSPDKIRLEIPNAWLVDRLLTNQDWVRAPLRKSPLLPTAVAFSVKGGVGRSTALSILAWYLARQGKNVLVLDLDLEAPGIGSILLAELPSKGLVDWIIESANGQGSQDLLISAIAEAPIGAETDGRVRVLPAYGSDTTSYISKLGRVYASNFDERGNLIGLAERLSELLERISALQDVPDVILIDSRAGLHDIGSAVVTRLGAEVFMFARNDDQDWWSYRQLFEHLRVSQAVAKGMGDDDDLRWKLKMVAAQTSPSDGARREWLERSYSEWTSFYDDESASSTEEFTPQTFARDDVEAPHSPLFINFDTGVRSARLNSSEDRPNWEFIQGIFGEFLVGVEQRLWPESIEGEISVS